MVSLTDLYYSGLTRMNVICSIVEVCTLLDQGFRELRMYNYK